MRRAGKVRGSFLPEEYDLSLFIQNIPKRHRSWSTNVPACEWSGVKCDPTMRTVTDLNWNRMKLTGSVVWSRLPRRVEILDLSENILSGPLFLDQLPTTLHTLHIFHNILTGGLECQTLHGGARNIYLGDNQFEGEVDLTSLPVTLLRFR